MSATNDFDIERLKLDDILACLVAAKEALKIVWLRMYQRMMTEIDEADLRELDRAMKEIEMAHDKLIGFHPDRLRGD